MTNAKLFYLWKNTEIQLGTYIIYLSKYSNSKKKIVRISNDLKIMFFLMSENFVTYFFLEFHVRYIELEINCEDTFDKKDFRDFSISSFLPNVHWIYYYLKWKAKFYWDEIYIGILYKYIHTYYYIHLFYSKSISNVKRFGCFTKLTNSIKRTGGVILCIYTLSSREVFAWCEMKFLVFISRELYFLSYHFSKILSTF